MHDLLFVGIGVIAANIQPAWAEDEGCRCPGAAQHPGGCGRFGALLGKVSGQEGGDAGTLPALLTARKCLQTVWGSNNWHF